VAGEVSWGDQGVERATYLDLEKVLRRAVKLLEGLRARIREGLHREFGWTRLTDARP
jgi:hypothetical protein